MNQYRIETYINIFGGMLPPASATNKPLPALDSQPAAGSGHYGTQKWT